MKEGVAASGKDEGIRYKFKRKAGTRPRPGTLGQVLQSKIEAGAAALFMPYAFTKAGPGTCGTYPATATLGVTGKNMAAAAPEAVLLAYAFVKCGTRRCGQ